MKVKKSKIEILYGLEATCGGTLKHLSYLVDSLNRDLFNITIILSTKRVGRATEHILKMEKAGATIINVPMERGLDFWKDLVALYNILKHLYETKFDIVHAHSSKAGALFRIAAYLRGVPTVIYTPHCFYFQSKEGFGKLFYSTIERLLSYITDYIIVSSTEKEWAIKYNINAKKLININNAVKLDESIHKDTKSQLKKVFGLEHKDTIIGSVGRLTKQKDWLTYINAANEIIREFPNVGFLIVGDGELLVNVQELVKQYKIEDNIIITGYYHDINDIYNMIDIFISTSLWEGLPYVILEAMLFKKPIIATDLGYGKLIENNNNGFLVQKKDYKSIAKKIKELIESEFKVKQMGEQHLNILNKSFLFKDFIKKHEAIYSLSNNE